MPESYGQFCPVAQAAEVLTERWTLLVVRELLMGSTRFNELQRGVPRMSSSLLSKRLRELERSDLLTREPLKGERGYSYRLTPAGETLYAQALEMLQALQSTRAMLRGHASAGQDVIEFAVPARAFR